MARAAVSTWVSSAISTRQGSWRWSKILTDQPLSLNQMERWWTPSIFTGIPQLNISKIARKGRTGLMALPGQQYGLQTRLRGRLDLTGVVRQEDDRPRLELQGGGNRPVGVRRQLRPYGGVEIAGEQGQQVTVGRMREQQLLGDDGTGRV